MEQQPAVSMYRSTRFIWYVFYVIEVLLGLRFALKLLAANSGAGFTELIYGVSGIFAAPFLYVFKTPVVGGSVFETGTLLAMVVYWILAWGIVKLISMNRSVDTNEAREVLESQDNA